MSSPGQPSATLQQAKMRLESAVERVEQALTTRRSPTADGGADASELTEARAEIGQLREKQETVSRRLDAAIGRMKVLLDEET
jgi:hypothetical protein